MVTWEYIRQGSKLYVLESVVKLLSNTVMGKFWPNDPARLTNKPLSRKTNKLTNLY